MNKKTIWVKAKCSNYYHFLSKVQYLNVNILEIKYEDNYIYLKTLAEDISKLQKYLVSYKFEIIKTNGLSNCLNKVRKNYIFLVSLLIGIVLFYFLNHLVIKINIVHENAEIRSLIKEELDSYGIKVLSFKKSYKELNSIREEILDKYPDKLDWMEFVVDGMIINVRVEERIITDTSKDDKVCNLIATKSGVINDILVNEGEVLVNINDYVREGDTLVSGIIKYNEEDKRYTCASGKIYATTWYTADVSIPLEYKTYIQTGKKKYNLIWEVDGNKKRILRSRFSNYDSKLKNIFHIFDFNIYLETELETEEIVETYTEDEALEVGISKAISNTQLSLGEFDEIIDKKVLKKSVNNSTMDIEVFIIVKQLISTEDIIDVEKNEEGID